MRARSVVATVCSLALLTGCGAVSGEDTHKTSARVADVDVSRAPGRQREASIAIDPSETRILVAGSNSRPGPAMRVYSSTDGGTAWTSELLPLPADGAPDACAADPGVGIDLVGRQYFSFVRTAPCNPAGRGSIFVATRPDPRGRWRTPNSPVAPREGSRYDDKPGLAVDISPTSPRRNRVYVAWTREGSDGRSAILIAHSDDGSTWAPAARVSHARSFGVSYAGIATAADGAVYVSWHDWLAERIYVGWSTDGGDSFQPERVVARVSSGSLRCRPFGTPIPAQPHNCVRANPIVSVDASHGAYAGRVYVTYGAPGANGGEDVFVAAFDPSLRPLAGFPRRINPADGSRRSDQFWPASAVDRSTGWLWACFYDTGGDPKRVKTRFSCTASADGGRTWPRPLRAATTASNATMRGTDSGTFAREYGDYEGLAVANGVAHPIWTDTRRVPKLKEEIFTTSIGGSRFR